MAIAVNTTRQALADRYGSLGVHISLHTGDPGTNGANETSGGNYARMPTTWTSGSSGTLNGSQVEIDVKAGAYVYAAIWTAKTGGSMVDKVQISSTTLGGPGKIMVTPTFTIT